MIRRHQNLKEVNTNDELMNYLKEYTYYIKISEKSNNDKLIKILKTFLDADNFKYLDFNNNDNSNNNNETIESWKICALFKALEKNTTIVSINILDNEFNSEVYSSIRDMLKSNNSIQRLQIFDDGGIKEINAAILAKGLEENKSLKFLEVSGGHNSAAANCILESLQKNTSIVQARIDNLVDNQASLERLIDFIKYNKNLVKLAFFNIKEIDYEPIIDALNDNNNLTSLKIEENPISISPNQEKEIVNLLKRNPHIIALPSFEYTNGDLMEELFESNKDYIFSLAQDLQTLDLSLRLPKNTKLMIKYDKIGKSLLKETIMNLGYDSEEEDIVNEICNYNIEEEKAANALMHNLDLYRNENFWYSIGVAKNILTLNKYIWTDIASFCKFEDIIHPPALQNAMDVVDAAGNDSNFDPL